VPLFRRRPPNWDETTPDDELVRWAQRGQHEAFGVLYDRYLTGVYGYCYRLLGEREAAQDANSVVFTKALAALPGYRAGANAGSFRGWLVTIAHNVIADELRARRSTASLESAEWVIDPSPSPEERAIASSERDAVLALLPQLSPDQRHVVALRLSGLTAVEIGEALGRPRGPGVGGVAGAPPTAAAGPSPGGAACPRRRPTSETTGRPSTEPWGLDSAVLRARVP
jgi:RNA polymerase sigma-70 factor (ECF subfamily)